MTLAHIGIGVFAIGAAFETAGRQEATEVLARGQSLHLAGFTMRLDSLGQGFGPNYEAERAFIRVTEPSGAGLCEAESERRTYAAGGQDVSQVAICPRLLDDVYVVAGDRRMTSAGEAVLVRAYWNPWVRFVFAGPLLMALGGLVSLSDRRLRFAVTSRVRAGVAPAPTPAAAE